MASKSHTFHRETQPSSTRFFVVFYLIIGEIFSIFYYSRLPLGGQYLNTPIDGQGIIMVAILHIALFVVGFCCIFDARTILQRDDFSLRLNGCHSTGNSRHQANEGKTAAT